MSRVPVVRGRFVGAVGGLLGVALAVPLIFLPTHTVGMADVEPSQGETPFEQSFWSWGRIAETTPDIEPQFDFSNIASLVFFIVSLLVAVAACLLYAFRPGADGRILGAAGVAWLAALVLHDLLRRAGETMSGVYGQVGFTVQTLPAGTMQTASAVTLCVALTAIAWRSLLALARPVWVWSVGVGRRAAERFRRDKQEKAGPPPRVAVATIRDAQPSYDQPAWHAGEGVGFSDDAEYDPERFRPPR